MLLIRLCNPYFEQEVTVLEDLKYWQKNLSNFNSGDIETIPLIQLLVNRIRKNINARLYRIENGRYR